MAEMFGVDIAGRVRNLKLSKSEALLSGGQFNPSY